MTPLTKEADSSKSENALHTGVIVLLVFILGVSAAAFLIWYFSSGEIPPTPADQVLVHSRAGVPYDVHPEPVERLIFIVLAALSPIGLVAYFWISGGRKATIEPAEHRGHKLAFWLAIVLAALVIFPFVSSDYIELLFFPTAWAKTHKTWIILAAVVGSAVVYGYSQLYSSTHRKFEALVWWALALIIIALQVVSYRISSVNMVDLSNAWSVHLDAALYALNQVVHGKTILAGLPSQYGFFPEILAPVFKAIGLSILSFTAVLALLQAIALIMVAVLLRRHIRNSLLAMLVLLALAIPMNLFMYLNGSVYEIYVQYFPVRFLGPALGLLLFSSYVSTPTKTRFVTLGLFAGLAVFWNLDTGIPILVAIGATLLVKPLIADKSPFRGLGAAIMYAAIALCTLVVCLVVLRIKAGVPLDLEEAVAAQKIFYMTGFGMIPMPMTPDPWQIILVIYATAAITALAGWQRDPGNKVYDLLLCTAVLGLGLFAYYQGRSHVNCLLLASWPAIIIGGVLTDRVLRAVRDRSTNRACAFLAVPFLLFICLGAITFISSSKGMALDAVQKMSTLGVVRDPVVEDELRFMRQTYLGRPCLILAQRQAVYSAELNIASPLSGPGIVETLLQSDLDKLVSSALKDPLKCIYLGVTPGSITFIDVNDAALMAKYPVISRNPLGTLMLLEPRDSAAR